MSFVTDTFTDVNGTLLTAHAGETGATWNLLAGYGANGGFHIHNDGTTSRLVGSGSTGGGNGSVGLFYASGTPATSEFDVSADVYTATVVSFDYVGLRGRQATGADTGYEWSYYQPDGHWTLDKVVAGAYTSLGTYVQTLSSGSTHTAKLELRTAAKKGYVDGTAQVTSADDAIAGAGRAALVIRGSTDSTGYQLDNFTAADPAGGAVAGAAALASASSLTARGSTAVHGAAALASLATQGAAARFTIPGAAALKGVATQAATAVLTLPGAAALAAVSTLAAAPSLSIPGAAALVSTSTLTAGANGNLSGVASLASRSTLTAAASLAVPGAASLVSVSLLRGARAGAAPAAFPAAMLLLS